MGSLCPRSAGSTGSWPSDPVLSTPHASGLEQSLGGATGLVLVNGTDRKEIAPTGSDQAFNMAPVTEDLAYGVTILRQPDGRTCTVENASGTMRDTDIGNVVVRCA